jgi:putative ABC transport system permease protein
MFRNYLVTALRNAARHKLFTFINIAGLAVALACAIFIALFIGDELSYDAWVPDSQDVYRAEVSLFFPGSPPIVSASSPFILGQTMKTDMPEVLAQTRLIPQNSTIRNGDRQFSERVDVVDPDFFSVIRLPLAEGDAAAVFRLPDSVVLSQAFARKYFAESDPVGKTLTMDGSHVLTVTGVIRDLPHNTQLSGDIFIPNTSRADQLAQSEKTDWFAFSGFTYVRLAPGADAVQARAKLEKLFASRFTPDILAGLHTTADQVVQAQLVPFRSVHLTSDKYGGMTPAGSWTTIYGFGAIAILIVLIACFNFMNLATARALMRAREVSLRKVMGARRGQLIAQFLGESVLTAMIALVFAFAAVEILLPAYDGFIGRPIALHYLSQWPLTAGIVAIALAAGLLSGIYPALVLSSFRPASTLKTNASGQSGSGALRNALVILQFAISIGLGIAALVVFAQIRYARDFDLGFDRDNIIVAYADPTVMNAATADSFMQALRANSAIADVAQSGAVAFEANENRSNASVPGNPTQFTVRTIAISPEFPATYGMKLLSGRPLSRAYRTDMSTASREQDGVNTGTNILIDASAARLFGFSPRQAVGRTIKIGSQSVTIVGVLQDALFHAAQTASVATIYYFNPNGLTRFSIRARGGRIAEAASFVDATWRRFAPTVAIRCHFLEDSFDKLFAADERQGAMFGIFVVVAIFIACLGLFGLAAFTAERRTKEIGIRKVFGASTRDVVRLLLWQFSIPILIANIIAWPVDYYYLDTWLEGYAYRIDLNPLYFIAAGLVAVAIGWATVLTHALGVARTNPIHALRYE